MTLHLKGHTLGPNPAFAGAMLALTWAFFGYTIWSGPRTIVIHEQPSGATIGSGVPPVASSPPPPLSTVDISGDLTILSNEAVRELVYGLNTKIADYTTGCSAKYYDAVRNKSLSDMERGALKLQSDAACNKDFRIKFLSDVLKVQTELRRRLNLGKDPYPIVFGSGILDESNMRVAANRLVDLAKTLP